VILFKWRKGLRSVFRPINLFDRWLLLQIVFSLFTVPMHGRSLLCFHTAHNNKVRNGDARVWCFLLDYPCRQMRLLSFLVSIFVAYVISNGMLCFPRVMTKSTSAPEAVLKNLHGKSHTVMIKLRGKNVKALKFLL
jgi:hypothetical protein